MPCLSLPPCDQDPISWTRDGPSGDTLVQDVLKNMKDRDSLHADTPSGFNS